MSHPLARITLALVLVLGLTGCVGDPSPPQSVAPSPMFTSDDEAFAAAEETYRAYVDALNQVDPADPATFEPVFDLTAGELNASDRTAFSEWHAEGVRIEGAASVVSVVPTEAHLESPVIVIGACYDVSAVAVSDAEGVSLVGPDRPGVQVLSIHLVGAAHRPGLVIERITEGAGIEC